jgi:hypothetical protein
VSVVCAEGPNEVIEAILPRMRREHSRAADAISLAHLQTVLGDGVHDGTLPRLRQWLHHLLADVLRREPRVKAHTALMTQPEPLRLDGPEGVVGLVLVLRKSGRQSIQDSSPGMRELTCCACGPRRDRIEGGDARVLKSAERFDVANKNRHRNWTFHNGDKNWKHTRVR